jgi:hypothetical protein
MAALPSSLPYRGPWQPHEDLAILIQTYVWSATLLLPLCEPVNRQLLQSLQALQRPPRGALPTVAIGRAGQVNVAQQQVHVRKRDAPSFQPLEPR